MHPAHRPMIFQRFILLLVFCGLAACDVRIANNDNASDATDEAATALESNQRTSHFLLGTGSVQGVYFPIGGVICRLLNRNTRLHGVRCSLESTGGSITNLRALRDNRFDLVFAQSDWQFHAYHGTSTFKKDGANEKLRAVFALEADPLALMVKQDSDIQSFDDLANRRVSFGYTRSLQHRIINDFLAVKGWSEDTFKEVRPMSDVRQIGQVCAGDIESILLLTSSLNDYLQEVPEGCLLRLVPIDGPEVKDVIKAYPYYRTGTILKGMYLDSSEDVASFGLGASFVANEDTSPKAIYHIVKEVVENFNDFKSLHPSLGALDKSELPYAGISIPLHSGAVRYYREARLIKN